MHFWSVAKPVLVDLLAAILFAVAFFASKDINIAVGVGIGVGLIQLVYHKARRQPIGPLQWLSLGLVVTLGAFTLVTHNRHFIMLKPTLLDLAAGAFMATRDWLTPYLPQMVRENVNRRTIARAEYGWAGLMFCFALANAIIAFTANFRDWLIYATFIPALIIVALFFGQYFFFQTLARRALRERSAARAG